MKVVAPAVTCLLTSHMKPTLAEAVASVLMQSRKDFELVIVDSGQWIERNDELSQKMAACYNAYSSHPLVAWVTTGELPGLAQRSCPVSWATNQAIRAGLVRGRYMCTFYDDDRYYPTFMEKMAGFLDEHPEAGAVWCSQSRQNVHPGGSVEPAGGILATAPKFGAQFDCQVDGAQVMWRTELLDKIGDPWLPEDTGSCNHSDGLFLNKIGALCGMVPNIDEILCVHRFTPWSTYTPTL